jgi:hypothetical protein
MRPYLQVAAICERHILEADGALTLFRIVDRFTVSGPSEEFPPTILTFMLVVSFRSGSFRGTLDLGLKVIDPSVQIMQEITVPTRFEGDDERASQFFANAQWQVKEEGLHWIIVSLAGEECTRIPFRVVYQRQPMIATGR